MSDRLIELLVEWDELRALGRDVPASELCPDDPALQALLHDRLEKRRRLDAYLRDPGTTADEGVRGDDPIPAVPGYAIESVLGAGGMGVVYRARDLRLNRVVALKMIRGEAGAAEAERFRVEAKAVAAVQHPNIVRIHEVGEAGGRPYLSLEHVPGGTLASTLDGRPLPPRRAAEVLARLADAVAHAHARGIVHRDLKPANVLIDADGEPKVADFGLVKRLGDSGGTQTGAILGSPCYMAPEQAEGRTRDVGPATDIHALGTVLYEALTGRPPYLGASPLETLDHVRTLDPVPPRDLQPGIPRDLERVCLKCLEKRPADRYASASDLADDVRRFLAGETILARPPSALESFARTLRRSNHDPRFSRYSGSLFIASPATLVSCWGCTLWFWGHPRFSEIVAWLAIAGTFVLQGFLTVANRKVLQAVPPVQRRQMATVWWVNVLAMLAAWAIVRVVLPADRPHLYLIVFPVWLLQLAIASFAFAADSGAFYVVGAAFVAAALACAVALPWSPLVVGTLGAANMLVQGLALRAMGRRDPAGLTESPDPSPR